MHAIGVQFFCIRSLTHIPQKKKSYKTPKWQFVFFCVLSQMARVTLDPWGYLCHLAVLYSMGWFQNYRLVKYTPKHKVAIWVFCNRLWFPYCAQSSGIHTRVHS